MNAKKFKIVCFSVVGVIVAILLAVNIACIALGDWITMLLCSTTELDATTRAAGETLASQIVEEGTVLVKNENESLPLDKDSDNKVNVFGWSATQWIVGGSGSGRVVDNQNGNATKANTDLLKALSDYGISYNTDLINMYTKYQSTRPNVDSGGSYGALHTYPYEFSRLYEPNMDYYGDVLSQAEDYSDTAIVVLGRITGESNDCPMTQYKKDPTGATNNIVQDTERTYLDISTEEEALLEYVGGTYENVIVVINSINTMNLGFMDNIDGLDSCLVVNGTGINGANVLPKLIYGEVSPSGRLVDTYAYEFATSSTFANSGENGNGTYSNANGLYPADGTTTNVNVSDSPKYTDVSYLDYAESIYVGYKWYETADVEGYWADFGGYDKVVQYPFGYGLSYTTFEWAVVETVPAAGTALKGNEDISVTVRVTNTGDMAAQEVVELYYTAPYTKGGIEKSAINLCAFAKTPTAVEPGESQDVVLTFNAADMASYDSYEIKVNGGGFILEEGEYQIKLMKNAHDLAEVTVGSAITSYRVSDDIIDPTNEGATNLFTGADAVDGVGIDGSDSDQDITYLSRADFKGTFPSENPTSRLMADNVRELNLFTQTHADAWLAENSDAVMPIMGAKNNLMLYNNDGSVSELGLELGNSETGYDDERWEAVLDQLTLNEMIQLTLHGYTHEEAVASVNKPRTTTVDGPAQAGSFNVSQAGTGYPNATTLAQSWNVQLSKSFGIALGSDAAAIGYSGLYAPGLNLHRSPFGGRNYEYYSEDSCLSGDMCSATIEGLLDAGVYSYIKHFIGYDQETVRDGVYCWMTEQALREIYLSPFKTVIQEGGATGLMTSYGRIGAVWSGGSEALLINVLREEWGFKGAIITDYTDHADFMSGDHMIRAGGDLWMDGWTHGGSYKMETKSAAFANAVRTASKHILYMGVNAAYENSTYNADEDTVPIFKATTTGTPWWIPTLIVSDVVIVAACAVWVFFALRKKEV